MKKNINKIIKRRPKIKAGQYYIVNAGDYIGKGVLFVSNKPTNGYYEALAICQGRDVLSDGFEPLEIPVKDVYDGIKKNIINFVDVLPKDIYNVYYQEWLNRKNKNDKFDN